LAEIMRAKESERRALGQPDLRCFARHATAIAFVFGHVVFIY